MKKIVINDCYGGFAVSKNVYEYLGLKWDGYGFIDQLGYDRDDTRLIEAIEELQKQGKNVNNIASSLKIVEIPDDVEWVIEEYDGLEWVSEKHRTWE